MDVSLITDINQLKALAYDFLVDQETAQNNLKIVNDRIAFLSTAEDNLPIDPLTIVAEEDTITDNTESEETA